MDSHTRSRLTRSSVRVLLLLTTAVLTVGAMQEAAGQTAPAGEAVMAWHVTIAPSWFDPPAVGRRLL
jgi:hypothetical protein